MPRHMRYDEVTTHSLAKEFNTEFNTVKRILEKQGVKPKRIIKSGRQTMIDWPKKASQVAIQAYLNERKEAAQAEAEATLRKAEELVQQRAKELAASVSNSVRIQNNTITPPAAASIGIALRDDGPNYAAAEESAAARPYAPEWDPPVVDLPGMQQQLNRIEGLMNQILDAITTPQGEPK